MDRRTGVIALIAAIALIGVVALLWPVPPATANASCVSSCRAQHNQCRIATKGSSSCDQALQSCLSACLRR